MAKRADQVSELALHDFQTNVEADEIVKAIHRLTREIHHRVVESDETPPVGP